MAMGDVKSGLFSISTTLTGDVKPPTGEEWVIHNFYYNGMCEFYVVDNTSGSEVTVLIDSDSGAGARLGMYFHLTNTHWLRVKNTAASNITFSYDGMQTK